MATFTLIPKPLLSVVELTYGSETITSIGQQVIEVDSGTVVSWTVSAGSQYEPVSGTKTITADYTEEVILK